MKKEERRAYMRALHEKEHPERTYYTREEWLLRKAAEKSTAKDDSVGENKLVDVVIVSSGIRLILSASTKCNEVTIRVRDDF